ncbi:MAG: hypothetical protein H6Q89_2949 [Myxococcaceae bacterium]|nr:hypothetical protein [Myxococcaceae bacterium]
MLNLALLLVLAADADAGCAWKDSKQPPKLEETGSGAEVTFSADPSWFRCAKRAGGKLELIWSVGEGGELAPRPPAPQTSYSARETVRELCSTPGLKQVQAQLKGSGEMEKLDWSSSIVEVYCQKCQWAGDDNILALHTRNLTPPGTWTLEATYDPKWWACAKPGAELEMRVFTGATRDEVSKAREPTHVVKGLGGPRIKKTFPKAAVCKGNPKYVAFEMGGSGEFRVLPAKGRSIQESQCQ